MKKIFALFLCLSLILALAACGAAPESKPAKPEKPAQESAPTESPAQEPEKPSEAPAAPEEAAADPAELVEKVLRMQGQPVEDLIELLGEPLSREYSSSCLVEGGQDGQLVYEGFTVYTLVQPDGAETVYDCELN